MRKTVADRLPESNRGFSIVELIIAAGILSGLALAAVSLGGSIFKPLQDLTKNIYDSIGNDVSVRSMAFELSNSQVMRGASDGSPYVTCSGMKSTLAVGQTSQSTTLSATGDAYGFGYSLMRTLGSTSTVAPNTISVPDTSLFQQGMVLFITSMDASKNQGLFSVTSIDNTAQTITLGDGLSQPPGDIGCKFVGRGNSAILFNTLQLKKFAVESLSVIRFEVADQPGQPGQHRLMARSWPAGPDLTQELVAEMAPNFISLGINEVFSSTTATKGLYSAAFTLTRWNTKVHGPAVQAAMSATAGYSMAGVEITNQAAVPNPPSTDNLFVTCGLSDTTLYANYIDGDSTSPTYNQVIPVYRIDAFYSESDIIDQQAPQLTSAFATGTGPAVRCWQATQIDCSDNSKLPVLKGIPPMGGVSFTQMDDLATPPGCNIDTSNALVVPVFCSVPADAQTTTKLNYSSPTAGAQTVNCSDTLLAGLTITWSYDGTASHCSSDGSIYLGRLVNAATNPASTGPVLGIKSGGCQWSGSASTSCNAYTVLKDTPDAVLTKVQLTPENTVIKNGSTSLSCN